jgi:hypothetical protein
MLLLLLLLLLKSCYEGKKRKTRDWIVAKVFLVGILLLAVTLVVTNWQIHWRVQVAEKTLADCEIVQKRNE